MGTESPVKNFRETDSSLIRGNFANQFFDRDRRIVWDHGLVPKGRPRKPSSSLCFPSFSRVCTM